MQVTAASRYDSSSGSRRARARSAASVAPGARVLDLGAGEGWYRDHFAGRRYLAVDFALTGDVVAVAAEMNGLVPVTAATVADLK